MTNYNEVSCVDKKLGTVQRSHQDGRAREPVWSDCTVLAQWRGAPRIPRNSRSRTSRSVMRCRNEGGIARLRRPLTQRALNSLSASTFSRGRSLSWDVVGNSFLQSRASSDISQVDMNSNGISNEGRPTLLSFL